MDHVAELHLIRVHMGFLGIRYTLGAEDLCSRLLDFAENLAPVSAIHRITVSASLVNQRQWKEELFEFLSKCQSTPPGHAA